ncbi:hypothetical protein DEO72_LG1g1946 [Vigna unguiculata]|uniref:Uncharacterized protein n=1 Tax=Vigna unguiculata TaxID=3917 RepID=A0A4D6KX99_VIGUN|nr:hypothetical protein DEO72_LG1g1946 [Vigna unguiculata]
MVTSTINLFTTVLFFLFVSQGYSKCSLEDIHVTQTITGVTVEGKQELKRLAQLIKPFPVALTLTLHSCRRFSSRHSPFPLTERSARVCPKVHFELAQIQFLLRLFSRSQDSSASYRAAKASVNPSSSLLDVCMDKWLFVVRGISCMMEGFGKMVSVAGESRARPGNLAQASRTRLSESGGGSPKPFFRPRVALQWSGRNSMAPGSGCPWWCPICITSSGMGRGIHHKCGHRLNPTKLYVSGWVESSRSVLNEEA